MKKGEILGIVGETGCGKTVTSRSVVKLLESNAVIKIKAVTRKRARMTAQKINKKKLAR